jgi:apolipoprotein N-acyltransferase
MLLSLLAVIFSGFLLVVAFPKYDHSYLLFIALLPWFWALRGRSAKSAFWLGLVGGFTFYLGLLSWIVYVTYVYGKLPLPLALGVLSLLAFYLAIYKGIWAWGVAWADNHRISLLWFAPAWWVVLEYVQGYPIDSFPWELLGHGLYRQPLLLQTADLIGTYGLSFLLVLINVGLFLLFSPALRGRQRHGFQTLALLIIIMASWLGYGYYRQGTISQIIAESPTLHTAVVQGNIEQGDKWDPKIVEATLKTYERLTGQVLAEKAPTAEPDRTSLVIWPETAAPFFFQRHPGQDTSFDTLVKETARENHTYLLFGAPAAEKGPEGEIYFNRAYLLNPKGELVGHYDKSHLVPWGEYVPFKRIFFFIQKMVPMIGDFGRGPVGATVSLPQGKVGVLICYESIFGYLSRAQVGAGAHILVNITNDAWFGTTSAPYQHMSMAVLRAVENRVSLARAANTGISAFVGADGRILWSSPLEKEAAHALDLPWLPGGSFYLSFGYLFPWACIIFAALIFLFTPRRRRLL